MVLSDLEEGGLCHVEMLEGRVAPPAVVVGQVVVGRAKVGGGDRDGAGQAPPGLPAAPHLVACPAREPVVKQGRAQGRSVGAVALTIQVSVPTCPTCTKPKT